MINPLRILLLFVLLFPLNQGFAQAGRLKGSASRTTSPVRIDGVLDEPAWSEALVMDHFVQYEPYNGQAPSFRTEVRIIYDNTGIYFGAMMYDDHPDSIPRQLGLRDSDWLNADDFMILLSPFDDGVNAFVFKLYSSDVQADYKLPSGTGDEPDMSWDAVWQSKAQLNEKGWVAEIRIPYSAIRFPKKPVQEWGFNCFRNIRRYRENSSWNFVNTKIDGIVNQSGILNGISDITPPLRLSLTPYVSGYVQSSPENPDWEFSYNYGADLKYGINQSFTLDMTLIPDFGQVPSDDMIYNFSPYEIKYDEKRQFFTEGTELFSKGGIFYSRRVGSTPHGHDSVESQLNPGEVIVENPTQTKLINATKISGNTTGNLGIGVFNAMSANTWASVRDTEGNTRKILTQGFTNYNMLVLNQALKNNSYFTVLNTNVYTPESGYCADVAGIDFKFANKKYTYGLFGDAFVSQKYYTNTPADLGYHYSLSFRKLSGNFQFSGTQVLETETYDPNDLGYNQRNNKFNNEVYLDYSFYDPFWKVLNWHNRLYIWYNCLYEDFKFNSLSFRGETNTTTQKHLTLGSNFETNPVTSYNYFEPRVDGWYVQEPPGGNLAFWVSTDYRKKFAIDASLAGYYSEKYPTYAWAFELAPRFQPNPRLTVIYSMEPEWDYNMVGYVMDSINPSGTESIIFGKRDVRTIVNVISGNYMFNSSMSINLRCRHYWVVADYTQFYDLQKDGTLIPNSYSGNQDINYNVFNIDLSYIWNFMPGSQLSVVWKNAINRFENTIESNYFDNLNQTLSTDASNSFSIRLLVYLDAMYFKKKRK